MLRLECRICGLLLAGKGQLKKHLRMVHHITDQNPTETKEFEQKYLQEIEHQAEVLKNAIRELKAGSTQKRSHRRKSPLTLGY